LKPETIDKLRQIVLNRPPVSEEVKNKCISNVRSLTLYNLNGTVYVKYISIWDATRAINCSEKQLEEHLKHIKS